jgi:hypothetical protein
MNPTVSTLPIWPLESAGKRHFVGAGSESTLVLRSQPCADLIFKQVRGDSSSTVSGNS